MNNRTCDNCSYYQTEVCPIYHHDLPFDACPNHTSKRKPSLFAIITQSPEVLAETYMFNYDGKVFKSLLLPNMVFSSREEAYTATVARLKEVYNETTSN